MKNVMGEVFWITYMLNSAPVYNSGHVRCKRRVISENKVKGEVFWITYILNSAP